MLFYMLSLLLTGASN